MKINKWVLAVIGLSICTTFLIYTRLPDTIPVHWNAAGVVDGYAGKIYILFMAFAPLPLLLFLALVPRLDKRQGNIAKNQATYGLIVNLIILFMVAVHWLVVGAASGLNLDMSYFLRFGMALLFMSIGNVMPRLKSNHIAGIRTPWTLRDDQVWQRTHRIGGYVFVLMGLAILGSTFLSPMVGFVFMMISILAGVLGLVAYSYVLSRGGSGEI